MISLVALLVLCAFLAQEKTSLAEAKCLVNSCLEDSDCSSCGFVNSTDYVYAQFKYRCQGVSHAMEPGRADKPGACVIDPRQFSDEDFAKAILQCKNGQGHKCCDIRTTPKQQLRHCSRRSCRIATGCSISGQCEYDLSDDSKGNTIDCCDRDEDCPPFSPPAYWDESLASDVSRICERPHCDRNSRTCEYKRAKDCCVADSPDCDKFRLDSSKCTVGACVYDAGIASALNINPFKDEESMRELSKMSIARNASYLRKTLFVAERSPLQCDMRIQSGCECSQHSDCVQFGNDCAVARCELDEQTERRVCVTHPTRNAPEHCCKGVSSKDAEKLLSDEELHEQCGAHLQDSCLVPVSCDSHGTRLHDDGTGYGPSSLLPYGDFLLPTYKCSYVRRSGTASCCAYEGDCAELADVNECVLDECRADLFTKKRRCELNPKGYAFMKKHLPCCYTDDDCTGGEYGDKLFRKVAKHFGAESDTCSIMRCTGDS